jgi:AcrR family transcriptional regulator
VRFKHTFMNRRGAETRDQVLQIATKLFAERGYHGTTMRQVAELGGFNLASGHYHYGSKRDLYLEVLRAQFAVIRREISRRGARVAEVQLSRLPRAELEKLLQTRIKIMLDVVVGPPPSAHGALMQREMLDPSEALPVIVDEFMAPMLRELSDVVTCLAPTLAADEIERCAYSIIGQILFYRVTMPALLHLSRKRSYSRAFTGELADHILHFTLGGLDRFTRRDRRRPPPSPLLGKKGGLGTEAPERLDASLARGLKAQAHGGRRAR